MYHFVKENQSVFSSFLRRSAKDSQRRSCNIFSLPQYFVAHVMILHASMCRYYRYCQQLINCVIIRDQTVLSCYANFAKYIIKRI